MKSLQMLKEDCARVSMNSPFKDLECV